MACASVHAPPVSVSAAGPAPLSSSSPLTALDEAGLTALLANTGQARRVVNFWATWCGPCIREMSVFREVAAEHSDVDFALVNVERLEEHAAVRRFLAAEGGGLPAFTLATEDAAGLLARAVPDWPEIIPVTLVLDPGGGIRARFDGALDAGMLRAALAP